MVMVMDGSSPTNLAGDFSHGLNQPQGKAPKGGKDLSDGDAREDPSFALRDAVLALAGGPFFELLVHFVADPAGFFNGLLHGEDKTGNGLIGEVGQRSALEPGRPNTKTSTWFAEVGMTLPCMNQNNGHFGGVSISLADHLGGRAELFGGPGDGGSRSQSAEFEFKNGSGLVPGKGHGIQFPKTVSSPMLVPVLRILVADDPPIPQMEVAGEDGTNPNFCSCADNREGSGLDPDFSRALSFPAATKGKALRPALIFPIIITDQIYLSVIRSRGWGVGMRVQDRVSGFLAPTTQQRPALQRARARVPDQNHSPPAENFWKAAQARRERPDPFKRRPKTTSVSQRNIRSHSRE